MPTDPRIVGALYSEICLFATITLLLVLFQANRSRYGHTKKLLRIFNAVVITLIISMASETLSWFIEGKTFPGASQINLILTLIIFLFGPAPFLLWTAYTDRKLGVGEKAIRFRTKIYWMLGAVNVVFCGLTLWNGMYFTTDPTTNLYHRGPFMWVSYALGFIPIAWTVVTSVQKMLSPNTSSEMRKLCWYHLLVPVPALIGALVQSSYYGVPATRPAFAISLLFYYISDQLFELRRVNELEQELVQGQIAIMLSQIQPHFLYNSLSAILSLCDTNVEQAKEAILDFSHYLRGNLDSLANDKPIPFEKELEHTNTYLALEKKRFRERLSIEYQIAEMDFRIPSLTLQPLVENAVRHGITQRRDGGTVIIKTEKSEEGFRVIVMDDGVGLSSSDSKGDEGSRSHVGISNVKSRLEAICGGSLDLQNRPDGGAIATIHIPKETQR